MSNTNKDFKDVAKKEVTQATHEVKGELTYEDKVIQKIIGLSLEKVSGLLAVDGGFFSNLADKLGSNYKAQGNVTIFTEKAACSSCKGVVDQFMKLYPNIRINIIHNKGQRLVP